MTVSIRRKLVFAATACCLTTHAAHAQQAQQSAQQAQDTPQASQNSPSQNSPSQAQQAQGAPSFLGGHSGDIGTTANPLTRPTHTTPLSYPDTLEGAREQGYLFNLRPYGLKLGQDLASYGIYLNGRTLQQMVDLTNGGLKRGVSYEGFNLFGIDLDMNRIAGIKGGSFHFLFNDLAGLPPQQYSGSFLLYNRAWAYSGAPRLNEFSYEQSFFDQRLDIRVGRLPVGTEFDFSSIYCSFIWGMCATPTAYATARGYPAYLVSSTAGVAKLDLTHNFYFNAGIYEDEPWLSQVQHLGFPGEDWSPDKIRGATVPLQFGYKTTFENDNYPRSFDIGGLVDTGDYNDPLLNSSGVNRAVYGGSPLLDHGKSEIWLQAEQTVFRPDFSNYRALLVFAGANFQTSGYTTVNNEVFAGVSFHGPFAVRPNDSVNFMVNAITLGSSYLTYADTSLALRGYHDPLGGTETSAEINYDFALAPGTVLKPSFAYFWNPDQSNLSVPTPGDRHAIWVGLAFSALLNDALGLPRFGGS
jgi:porin